jgi:hypothetical protein
MSSKASSPRSRPPFQPGQSVHRKSEQTSPYRYSHTESHHIIRFKTAPTHNTRQQARAAAKKRLDSSNALDTSFDTASVRGSVSTSKLKTGNEARGRDKQRSSSLSRSLRRSLSSKRSTGNRGRSRSSPRHIKIVSSSGSVCSQSSMRSSKSMKSLKTAGSAVMTKVKSFRRSRSIDARSVGSTTSRKSWFGRRRKNKINGTGENFMFVQQESVPEELLKKKRTARKTGGFLGLGFLCGSFEPICSSLFCQDDEDLIGKVVGSNDPQTPDTSVEYDLDDPRF